jgi:heptosyltransferase-3
MGRSILVIHPGSLGDVLLALPALRALRVRFPEHRHILIAGAEVGRLLRSCAEIDELISTEEGVLAALLGATRVPARIRECVGHCDLAVGWMHDKEGTLAASLQALGARSIILRSPADPSFDGSHQSDRFLRIVQDVVWPGDYRHRLSLNATDVARGLEILSKAGVSAEGAVGLQPGSGSRYKCCAPSIFSEVVSVLAGGGYLPILLGGPADADAVDEVIRRCTVPVPVVANLDLIMVAALLTHLDLYVGHDSGLTHLAASLHRPTLALFGPTSPQRWAPQGGHVWILSGGPCACATWTEVLTCRDQPCLQLSAERVVAACKEIIGQQRLCESGQVKGDFVPCSNR